MISRLKVKYEFNKTWKYILCNELHNELHKLSMIIVYIQIMNIRYTCIVRYIKVITFNLYQNKMKLHINIYVLKYQILYHIPYIILLHTVHSLYTIRQSISRVVSLYILSLLLLYSVISLLYCNSRFLISHEERNAQK